MTNLKKALELAEELELATHPMYVTLNLKRNAGNCVVLTKKEFNDIETTFRVISQRALMTCALIEEEIATEKAVWEAIEKERRRQNAKGGEQND